MPDSQADEAALTRIVRGLTERDERIREAIAEENFPLAWHELDRTRAFLDAELDAD